MDSAPEPTRPSRLPVAQLIQQVADIISQGEESGTPSQHTEIIARLQSVMLQLLDRGISSNPMPRVLTTVIQLLKLTLEKVPYWFASSNNDMLLQFLERFISKVAQQVDPKYILDIIDGMSCILESMINTDKEQCLFIINSLCALLQDICQVALCISSDPSITAKVTCHLRGNTTTASDASTNSNNMHDAVRIHLESSTACESMLHVILKVCSHCIKAKPSIVAPQVPRSCIEYVRYLLSSTSIVLQTDALDFLGAYFQSNCMMAKDVREMHVVLKYLEPAVNFFIERQGTPVQQAAVHEMDNDTQWILSFIRLVNALSLPSSVAARSPRAATLSHRSTLKLMHMLLPHHSMIKQTILRNMSLLAVSLDPGSDMQNRIVMLLAELIHGCDNDVLAAIVQSDTVTILTSCSSLSRRSLLHALRTHLMSAPRHHAVRALNDVFIDEASSDDVDHRHIHADDKTPLPPREEEADRQSPPSKRRKTANRLLNITTSKDRTISNADDGMHTADCRSSFATQCPSPVLALAAWIKGLTDSLRMQCLGSSSSSSDGDDDDESVLHAMHALSDVISIVILPIAPHLGMNIVSDVLRLSPKKNAFDSGGMKLSALYIQTAISLVCCGLNCSLLHQKHAPHDATMSTSIDSILPRDWRSLLMTSMKQSKGASSPSKTAADQDHALSIEHALALSLFTVQLNLPGSLDCLVECFEAAKHPSMRIARALLLPVAASLACIALSASSAPSSSAPSSSRRQKISTVIPTNSLKAVLIMVSADIICLPWLVKGLLIAMQWNHDPATMINHAVHALESRQFSRYDLYAPTMLAGSGPAGPSMGQHASEWMRSALEILTQESQTAAAHAGVDLVAAVALYLERASLGQLEHSRSLAEWLVDRAASDDPSTRVYLMNRAPLFASPKFLLTGYHTGPHPVNSVDRRKLAEKYEQNAFLAFREKLNNVARDSDKVQDMLQLITAVGFSMSSSVAHMLTLASLMQALENADATVSAAAAQALRCIARLHGCSVRSLFFSTPKLLEHMGKELPQRPHLLNELADIMRIPPYSLCIAVIPRALPVLFSKSKKAALENLAKHAKLEVRRMLTDYGHYPFASSLMHGQPKMESLMSLCEELSGLDFLYLAKAVLSKTVSELVVQTGSLREWTIDENVPESTIKRTSELLLLLATTSAGDSSITGDESATGTELSTADFLAGGDHVTRMLKEFGDQLDKRLKAVVVIPGGDRIQYGDKSSSSAYQLQGQQVLALRDDRGAATSSSDVRDALCTLRSILVLVRLTGSYVGRFLPQFMVLLGSAAQRRYHKDVRLQALNGWLILVKALTAHSPLQLGGVVNQIVVSLLDAFEDSGAIPTAAARVVEEIVAVCKEYYPNKLRLLPPLPPAPELRHVNNIVEDARGNLTTQERIELLLESLKDEALSVRSAALLELRSHMAKHRDFLLSIEGMQGNHAGFGVGSNSALLQKLMRMLVKSTEPEAGNVASVCAQQACAECIGMLGAVDPSRINLDARTPAGMCTTPLELAVAVVTKHLVRLLKTAPSMQYLDLTTLSTQDVLRCYSAAVDDNTDDTMTSSMWLRTGGESSKQQGGRKSSSLVLNNENAPAVAPRASTPPPESNALFALLPEEVQAIVRPYLDSKYSMKIPSTKVLNGVVFTSAVPHITFRKWVPLWLTQLTEMHITGEHQVLFKAINPVLYCDIPTALFLAPYVVYHAVAMGNTSAPESVAKELQAVFTTRSTSRDAILCMQAAFTVLDTLQHWLNQAKAAHNRPSSAATATVSASSSVSNGAFLEGWEKVQNMLHVIPKDLLAGAASRCGAHARALLYYETHMRSEHGGGINIASASSRNGTFLDHEVSFLLEIYGFLEEPDGLDGFINMKSGGPKLEDQRWAAEKAGSWSEALALYDQALAATSASSLVVNASETRNATSRSHSMNDTQSSYGDDTSSKIGYLNCLLHMGHWQSVITCVEGMAVSNHHQQQHQESMGVDAGGVGGGSRAPFSYDKDTYNRLPLVTSSTDNGTDSNDAAQLAAMGTAAAWRLGQWSQVSRYVSSVTEHDLLALDLDARWELRLGRLLYAAKQQHEMHGTMLKSPDGEFVKELKAARAEIMGPFSAAAMESYTMAYPFIVKLHMLQEIMDAMGFITDRSINHGPRERKRALQWDARLNLTQASLSTQGPILALRRQLALLTGGADDVGECWLQQATLCRSTGHVEAARRAALEALAAGVPGSSLELVELLYAHGEQHRALTELHRIKKQLDVGRGSAVAQKRESDKDRYRARVLLKLAEWSAETGQSTTEDVSSLFEEALSLRDKWETGLFKYAVYLDQLMQDAKGRQENAQERKIDRLFGRSKIQLGVDRPYLQYLPEVLHGYGKCVQAGHKHIYRALPRLLSLWFDFGTAVTNSPADSEERLISPKIMQIIQNFTKSIPIHCWLIALPQLISRICHRNAEVATTTKELLKQITAAYPQQSLWLLAEVSKSAMPGRRNAATTIISNAKKLAPTDEAKTIFGGNSILCEQLIKLCTQETPQNVRMISAKKEFSHLTRIMPVNVVVPFARFLFPAVPPSGLTPTAAVQHGWSPYEDPVTITGIKDEIIIMRSLMRPKKIIFIGSDGQEYGLLAKPKDDLRKDSRMMEIASMLNQLFLEHPDARRRNLRLRRFAAIPITEACGLVEWVNHTHTMRGCISDLFREGDVNETEANKREKALYDEASKSKRPDALIQWLEKALEAHPPRFHKWFVQKFPEPAAWLDARLAYTRTYAAWCAVGHVVGLGDRHGENVLIDMKTGDTIHIDFGCIFDKGLVLQQPEVVPFRLTHNVVDGFGVAGIEGVYRRSFEATMTVLRAHREDILSVMDTFVHDPLVDWKRTPALQNVAQKSKKTAASTSTGAVNDEYENPYARDWLDTIDGRLKGTLLGVSSRPCMPLSVEGHTQRLIQEAVSKENLSKMYIWWQAWY